MTYRLHINDLNQDIGSLPPLHPEIWLQRHWSLPLQALQRAAHWSKRCLMNMLLCWGI